MYIPINKLLYFAVIKKFLLTIIFFVGCVDAAVRLSEFDYGAASVLPVYTYRGKQYAILAREAYGKDKGTYDDFGGRRDRGENHPLLTAAREWNEEGLVGRVTRFKTETIRKWIDRAESNNTENIIAYTGKKAKNVTYITDVTPFKDKLLYRFYGARKKAKSFHNKEKDRVAVIKVSELENAFLKNKNRVQSMNVQALVVNPVTNRLKQETITLRPFFVVKIRPYFLKWPYKRGLDKKIRFYSVGNQASVR